MSVLRLHSAAPWNTYAWPPIKRQWTPCVRIEEKTLRIGLGVKRASQRQERRPECLA
jgi:hypothetical protein